MDAANFDKPAPAWYRTAKLPAYLFAIALAIVFCFGTQASVPRAEGRLLLVIALGGALVLTSLWYSFLSAAPWPARKRWTIATVSAVALFMLFFEVESTPGDVFPPVFRWRLWGRKADYALTSDSPHQTAQMTIKWSARNPGDPLPEANPRLVSSIDACPGLGDYPGFLGPNRDSTVRGVKLATDWDRQPPRKLWRQPIGAGWSAFAVAGTAAVTLEQRGEYECVVCYDLPTHKIRWWYAVPGRFESKLGGDGPRSTPLIDAGRVFTLATGNLSCLDLTTGEPVWPTRSVLQDVGTTLETDAALIAWGRSNSPLVVEDALIVPGGGPDLEHCHSLVAYDKQTGKLLRTGGNQQISYSSPSLFTLAGTRQIVIVNEASITGHDAATLQELWRMDWPGGSSSSASVPQTHQISSDTLFVSKGYSGGGMVFRVGREENRWIANKVWHKSMVLKTKFSNVVLTERCVFGLSDGLLEAADLAQGTSHWKVRHPFGHGQILLVDDLLLVLGEDGEVTLCETNPKEFVPLTKFQALEGKCWANPALAGRYLVVRNALEAACYELPMQAGESAKR